MDRTRSAEGAAVESRAARVARGAVAASFATLVAALSHALADGVPPTVFGLAASLVLSVMLCSLLAGRTLSLWRTAASVGLSQVLFHALFSGMGSPVAVAHDHLSTMGAMDAAAPHHSPAMWLAHTAAGLVTIVALRYAERAFWGVADTARLVFSRLLPVVVPVLAAPKPLVAAGRRTAPAVRAILLSPMRHRGPPMELAAA